MTISTEHIWKSIVQEHAVFAMIRKLQLLLQRNQHQLKLLRQCFHQVSKQFFQKLHNNYS